MKKIGILLGTDPGSGGMFQYSLAVLDALSALPRERYTIVAAFFNLEWKPYLEKTGIPSFQLSDAGREPLTLGRIWRSLCLPVVPWRKIFWRLDPVARALRATDCDLWVFPSQDHWSYLAPVPAMVAIHDLMHRYEPQFPEVSRWGRYFIREYRFRNICRQARAVLVDSEVGRKHVMESYALDAGKIFPLPYLPPGYIHADGVPDGFDSRYSLPSHYLFYPAQFWQHKNHDRLLQAVAMVSKECPDISLVLAGPTRYEYQRLAARVEDLGLHGRVFFIGYVPDVDLPELYRRARALIMPTFFGPTNIPPLEAFELGCPVAVSDIYGMREQLGNASLYFDPESVEEIADVIRRIWTDDALRRELVSRGRGRAASWSATQFNRAYENIIHANL